MWKTDVINYDSYNCFQFVTSNIAAYYNCDYRAMMLELWGFKYKPNHYPDELIGDRLGLCWNGNLHFRKKLLLYHGLEMTYVPLDGLENNIIHLLNIELEKGPIGVYLDSFECSWLPYYQKLHRPHAIILHESTESGYVGFDQFCDSSAHLFQKLFLSGNVTGLLLFSVDQKPESSNLINLLQESIMWYKELQTDAQYLQFAYDLENNLCILNEIPADPTKSKLVMYLKNLSDDYFNFIEFLELLADITHHNVNQLVASVREISAEYAQLRAYLIKNRFLNKTPSREVIHGGLQRISDNMGFVLRGLTQIIGLTEGDYLFESGINT